MNNELEELRIAYLDAVRLYVWYGSSKFSLFQGKASKPLAEQYKVQAQVAWIRYQDKKNGGK